MLAVDSDAKKDGDIRFLLRRETRLEHEDLDARPDFVALADGTLDIDAYGRVMQALHAAYGVIDPLVAKASARTGIDAHGFAYAPRLALLSADLDAIGMAACGASMDIELPQPESAAALAGLLYVVEGSLLGGSVLAKGARRVLAGGEGGSYWEWCVCEGGGRWAMTCRLLSNLDRDERSRQAMISNARAAFRVMSAAFGTAPERSLC